MLFDKVQQIVATNLATRCGRTGALAAWPASTSCPSSWALLAPHGSTVNSTSHQSTK
jgi:hypothetical protein